MHIVSFAVVNASLGKLELACAPINVFVQVYSLLFVKYNSFELWASFVNIVK